MQGISPRSEEGFFPHEYSMGVSPHSGPDSMYEPLTSAALPYTGTYSPNKPAPNAPCDVSLCGSYLFCSSFQSVGTFLQSDSVCESISPVESIVCPAAACGLRQRRLEAFPAAHWPRTSAETEPTHPPLRPSQTARFLFAGDVMQHLPLVLAARNPDGTFDYTPVFAGVRPYFAAADLAAVNLETTLTASADYAGYPCFRSPLSLASALCAAGVDVCVLANNHCFDGGRAGVRTTLAELDRLGIRHTGVFADSLSRRHCHPLITDVNGIRFALLNYTYSTNGIPAPRGITVNVIDTTAMRQDLAFAHAIADCTVVLIHWGNEYERQPNRLQQSLAAFLRRNGADLVIGSHPHVVQPFEADSSGAVFYSLGNFVSNQRRRYCDGGLMALVSVTRRPDGSMCYAACAVPVWVLLPGYRILPLPAADTISMPAAARADYCRFKDDMHLLLEGCVYK